MKRCKRKRRPVPRRPEFTVKQILRWADAFYQSAGRWPTNRSGRIANSLGENWNAVDVALRKGFRGLPAGSSLPRLLAEQRGVRNLGALPPLSIPQILEWADDHHRRTGEWPCKEGGPISDAPGENWGAVGAALWLGIRGLPGGSSLARLLAEQRGVPHPHEVPPLTEQQVLAWADAHHARTGHWPTGRSGAIPDSQRETWRAVGFSLYKGLRGFPGGSSLARLLEKARGVRNEKNLSSFTIPRILAWSDAHHRRTGQWPNARSGPIVDASGESWAAVDGALSRGWRGLPGGTSLPRLLAEQRGVRNQGALPRLTPKQILGWARAHHRRTGRWPRQKSGAVLDAPGETWGAIDSALNVGGRGLPGGSSLARLLKRLRG
jgi:hypothetical protein